MRNIDEAMQEKVLAVARAGMTSAEAIGFFRVSLGLYYLAGLMTQEELDFKKIDAKYNRFIYHTLGGGGSVRRAGAGQGTPRPVCAQRIAIHER